MKCSIGLAKAIQLCCGNNDRLEQVIRYLEEWDVLAGGVRQSDEDRQSKREALDKARALLVALRRVLISRLGSNTV